MIAKLKALWAREPVLVAALLPLAVSLGLISSAQSSVIQKVLEVIGSLLVLGGTGAVARSQVSPTPPKP